jgi:hypothetical protein
MRKTLGFVTVLCVAVGVVLTGCSLLPEHGGTGLRQALARVAATSDTRVSVMFDATGELTKLVGRGLSGSGWGALLLDGTGLGQVARDAPGDTGIAPLDADYGISAGLPPRTVSVLVGGQRSDRVATALTKLGWTKSDDRYVAPALNTGAGNNRAAYVLNLAQVRTDGPDVVFGKHDADLGTAGHPHGKTLAEDQPTDALADCLGDVVVAQLTTNYHSALTRLPPAAQARVRPAGVQIDKLTEVAVGVRTPKSASDTPRAVVCTAWADQPAADGYAAALPGILASGTSLATNEPYAHLLHNPQTKKVGGGAHVVEWSADEANQVTLVINMLQVEDLPGLV